MSPITLRGSGVAMALVVASIAGGCGRKADIETVPLGSAVEVTRDDGGFVRGTLKARDADSVKMAVGPVATRTIPRKVVDPCVPASWSEYQIAWRYLDTRYDIVVSNPDRRCRGVRSATLDGVAVDARALPLVNDGKVHRVAIVLGLGGA